MKFYSKLAVFDLDDTLYIGNSHIEILCRHYHTRFFKTLLFKLLGKILPQIQQKIMVMLYERISDEEKEEFLMPYSKTVLKLLRQKESEGYHIIIISNAPKQLLVNAAKKLELDYISANVNCKGSRLIEKYKYDFLFVCTDNKTDIDLLELADEAIITCKKKHIEYFKKRLINKNIKFINNEDRKC